MLHFAVTAYLAFVAFVGPGMCCCSCLQLAAELTATPVACLGGGHSLAHHCGCHRHRDGAAEDSQQKCPSSESPRCPCDGHRAIPVALQAPDVDLAKQCRTGAIDEVVPAAFCFDLAGEIRFANSPSVAGEHPGSRLTGRDILRALCMLRC